MKRLALFGLMALSPLLAAVCVFAQDDDRNLPYKALSEIARRGTCIEHVDGFQSGPESPIADVAQPPPDDSHKWQFTLVTLKDCEACERLRSDFEFDNATELRAWVHTKDPTQSYSNWQVVQFEDKSQEWRWKELIAQGHMKQFPVLLVQPPTNGSWGDKHTIVYMLEGYLPPAKLHETLRVTIGAYAKKVQPQHMAWEAKQGVAATGLADGGFQQTGADQQTGSWTPPVSPVSPLPAPVQYPPHYQPQIQPANPSQTQPQTTSPLLALLMGLLGGGSAASLLQVGVWVWGMYREMKRAKGEQLVFSDETYNRIADAIARRTPPTNQVRS